MFGGIRKELAKLIAQAIFNYLKNAPGKLKELGALLKRTGQGLPESVLVEFEKRFDQALNNSSDNGYGKWKDGKDEVKFKFLLVSTVIDYIRKRGGSTDWAKAASQTAAGQQQITLLGGNQAFNDLMDGVTPLLVEATIAANIGEFHSAAGKTGVRILTAIVEQPVAKYKSKEFAPAKIFYIAQGNEKDTAAQYKLAKKLVKGGWGTKRQPFEGPYFNP